MSCCLTPCLRWPWEVITLQNIFSNLSTRAAFRKKLIETSYKNRKDKMLHICCQVGEGVMICSCFVFTCVFLSCSATRISDSYSKCKKSSMMVDPYSNKQLDRLQLRSWTVCWAPRIPWSGSWRMSAACSESNWKSWQRTAGQYFLSFFHHISLLFEH